jgi:hypothetical protein
MVVMCDYQTRIWCARICTLFFVFAVLMMMIVQIWNYYFSLLYEMDMILEQAPQLAGIVEICDHKIDFEWNVHCWMTVSSWVCDRPPSAYVDTMLSTNTQMGQNVSSVWVTPVESCFKLMFWILPW